MKRILLILFALLMLTGCAANESTNSETVLWVITEQSTSDGMNYQLKNAVEAFEAENEAVAIRVDILPTDESEREVYLKQLRTQIMAGDGPDVYLLPTGNVLTVDSRTKRSQTLLTTQIDITPLFQDVTQAMYSGVFADISSFYDGDTELNIEALQQDVMDAGVINGCRYVLPLRYTMPLLLTEPSNYDETGLTQELMDSGITAVAEYALNTGDAMMAAGLQLPNDTTLLPQLFDYENGEMLITVQEIADYMRLYQRMCAITEIPTEQLITDRMEELRVVMDELTHYSFEDVLSYARVNITLASFNDVYEYGRYGYHWSLEGFPLYADSLTGALDQSAISKVLDKELEAQPMRSTCGNVVAEVTYYGAVGSGCENPELAYDFLRLFLTEAYQWDLIRPRASRENIDQFNLPQELQVDGMVEDSWPVRTDGATSYLWDTLQYQNFRESYVYEDYHKELRNRDLDIADADMPILQVEIDEVRFPFYQPYEESLSYALSLLNGTDGVPTVVDIDELAEQVYQYLWWHLAEG